jgi:DNA-binding XRE family transcriptional regulator
MPLMVNERLRKARKAKGLSQEALAQVAGVTVFTINRLERTGRVPTLATAHAVAEALGKGVDDLWPRENVA